MGFNKPECVACGVNLVGLEEGMNKWQGIETAPKDGTLILGCSAGTIPMPIYWDVKEEAFIFSIKSLSTQLWVAFKVSATHWMPSPPTDFTAGEDENSNSDRDISFVATR